MAQDRHHFLAMGLIAVFLMAVVSIVAMVLLVSHGSAIPSGSRITSQDGGNVAGAAGMRGITESVTCLFNNSQSSQVCVGVAQFGTFNCTGVQSCSVKVTGPMTLGPRGLEIIWSGSCSGTARTQLDGKDEVVSFWCAPPPSVEFRYDDFYTWNNVAAFTRLSDGTEISSAVDEKYRGALIAQGYSYPFFLTETNYNWSGTMLSIDTDRDGSYETSVPEGYKFTLR